MPPVSDQSITPPLSWAEIAHYQELRAVLVYVQRQPRGRLVSIDEVASACGLHESVAISCLGELHRQWYLYSHGRGRWWSAVTDVGGIKQAVILPPRVAVVGRGEEHTK